jgi:transcriptional regulator GlxA family with amidase domain
VFRYRTGSQSQFSAHLAAQCAEREPLRDVQLFVVDNLAADLSVTALARRAGMSARHFARVFAQTVGAAPARYVESVRVEAARELLERSADPIKQIAQRCGFGTEESMRRSFSSRLGIAPSVYRQRFAGERETS